MMYDTKWIINEGHCTRSFIALPALPVSTEPNLRGSRGAMRFSRTRAVAGIGPLAISPPRQRSPTPSGWAFYWRGLLSAVAFSARVLAKIRSQRAYHTTSYKFRSNTNQCPDKKSRGLPASRPAVPRTLSCSPVSAALSPVPEGVAPRGSGISYDHGFPNRSIQEKD